MITSTPPIALITGGARRIGATIAQALHGIGYRVAVHYRHSAAEATALVAALEHIRPHSTSLHRGDLSQPGNCARIIDETLAVHGALHLLINNAAEFFPTRLADTTEAQWQTLFNTNLKAPYFLAQAAAAALSDQRGAIINITDIYGERPLNGHTVYCTTKAGLIMLTQALAVEMAPLVRVNAVSPGVILWPEVDGDVRQRQALCAKIPLQIQGAPEDVAQAVCFLAQQADYMTGQIVRIDGGRSVAF